MAPVLSTRPLRLLCCFLIWRKGGGLGVGRERGREGEGERMNIPVFYTSQSRLEDQTNNVVLCK